MLKKNDILFPGLHTSESHLLMAVLEVWYLTCPLNSNALYIK